MIHREILSSPGQSCHCQPGKGEGATESERPGPIQMLILSAIFTPGSRQLRTELGFRFSSFVTTIAHARETSDKFGHGNCVILRNNSKSAK